METLPPEMIRAIYAQMDPLSAYRFRGTCRDYNNIFLNNRSVIKRFEGLLHVKWQNNCVELMVKEIDENAWFSTICVSQDVNGKDDDLAETFDVPVSLFDKEIELQFNVADLGAAVESILDNLTQYYQFTSIYYMESVFNDEMLGLFAEHFRTNSKTKIGFMYSHVVFRDTENWNRFLLNNHVNSVVLCSSRVESEPFFTDYLINFGMKDNGMVRSSGTPLAYRTAIRELQQLLRNDAIEYVSVTNVRIAKDEVFAKIKRYYAGNFSISFFEVWIDPSSFEEFMVFMDTIGTRQPSRSETIDEWELITLSGCRSARIVLSRNSCAVSLSGRYRSFK